MKNKKIILWDFDGVIMDSNRIRDLGFEQVLKNYPKDQVNQLMDFHQKNGGLSRYVKFRYFFEEVRKEEISEEEVRDWAAKFSRIMLNLMVDKSLLIEETMAFIERNHDKYHMHIVSGSDQEELRTICRSLNIDHYFVSIHGSPTPKKELIANILNSFDYKNAACFLIGDSINDWEAAVTNNISFVGYGTDRKVHELTNHKFTFHG